MLCGEPKHEGRGLKLPLDLLTVEFPLSFSVNVPSSFRQCGRAGILFQANSHLLTDLTEPLHLEYSFKSKFINFDEMEVLMKQIK